MITDDTGCSRKHRSLDTPGGLEDADGKKRGKERGKVCPLSRADHVGQKTIKLRSSTFRKAERAADIV